MTWDPSHPRSASHEAVVLYLREGIAQRLNPRLRVALLMRARSASFRRVLAFTLHQARAVRTSDDKWIWIRTDRPVFDPPIGASKKDAFEAIKLTERSAGRLDWRDELRLVVDLVERWEGPTPDEVEYD